MDGWMDGWMVGWKKNEKNMDGWMDIKKYMKNRWMVDG